MADGAIAAKSATGKFGTIIKYLVGSLLLVLALAVIFYPLEKLQIGPLIQNNQVPITVLIMLTQLFQTTLDTTLKIDRLKNK